MSLTSLLFCSTVRLSSTSTITVGIFNCLHFPHRSAFYSPVCFLAFLVFLLSFFVRPRVSANAILFKLLRYALLFFSALFLRAFNRRPIKNDIKHVPNINTHASKVSGSISFPCPSSLFRRSCRNHLSSQAPIQSRLTPNIIRGCQWLVLGDIKLLSVLARFQIMSCIEVTFQGCQTFLAANHAGNLIRLKCLFEPL
jgi:hypothetical protein